jgi:hypothetical protein
MRLNRDGILGLAIMTTMVMVSVSRRGAFIAVIVPLVIIYGISLLAATVSAESQGNSRAHSKIEMIALHISFALIVSTFFLELKHQPFINLVLAPLALLAGHCFAWTALTPVDTEVEVSWSILSAVIPVVVLVSVMVAKDWGPIWYFYAALVCYSLALLGIEVPSRETAIGRYQLGIFLALTFFSLGLLIDVNSMNEPRWIHGTAFTYHLILRTLILVGCVISGLVLPYFLLTPRGRRPA